jgi:periplasmic divalent cation tolerance protein
VMSTETMENQACVVLVTCGTPEEAEMIAETIVIERLAACVNVIGREQPIRSFYMWEGKLQKENEILLVIKTTPSELPQLERRIQELHSYTVPEFIALPLLFGGQSYIEWIKDNVTQS